MNIGDAVRRTVSDEVGVIVRTPRGLGRPAVRKAIVRWADGRFREHDRDDLQVVPIPSALSRR